MESHHKKSSTSPMTLPHCSDISIQNVPRKTVSFQNFAKSLKKCLTTPGFSRIIAHVERLTSQTTKQILGICIVVVR